MKRKERHDPHTSRRNLFFESLERRSLLAGNVLVSVENGNLIIQGDDQDNNITVQQVDIGKYVVSGFTTTEQDNGSGDGNGSGTGTGEGTGTDNETGTGLPTLINGSTDEFVATGVTGDIDVRLEDGNDLFIVSNSAMMREDAAQELSGGSAGPLSETSEPINTRAVTPRQTGVPNRLLLDLGEGDNGVYLSVRTGSGIGNGNSNGNGNDSASVASASCNSSGDGTGNGIGTGTGTGNGGNGTDTELPSKSVGITAADGDDNIQIVGSIIRGDLDITTEDGNDNVLIDRTRVRGNVFVSLGHDDNTLEVTNLNAQDVEFETGNDEDTVSLMGVRSRGDFSVSTANGDDTINLMYIIALNFLLSSGNDRDTVSIDGAFILDNATIETGFGDDGLMINDADIGNELAVDTGGDDDSVEILNSLAFVATIEGGDDRDTANVPNDLEGAGDENANSFDSLTLNNFEIDETDSSVA